MREKTPKQIVDLLDKYIVGQNEAKKSVAIALYNRYRRAQLPEDVQKEVQHGKYIKNEEELYNFLENYTS